MHDWKNDLTKDLEALERRVQKFDKYAIVAIAVGAVMFAMSYLDKIGLAPSSIEVLSQFALLPVVMGMILIFCRRYYLAGKLVGEAGIGKRWR